MVDQNAFSVVLALLSAAAGVLVVAFGPLLVGIACFALAALIALAMWTPARSWLGIPQPVKVEADNARVGYIGRKGSTGNLKKARFGKALDVGIDNAGDVDAEEATFDADDKREDRHGDGEPRS
jgi:hypothetical protein